ncbi:phage regulatory CII family protein [Qipengyuania proteolytica]|uniref:phage regulatory CII family protein n=1 Tax=Qipengyuania proteolytica TaxID=2867239 RepID=UPI0031E79813
MGWFSRMKLACIDAVEQAGGKEGAGATAERSASTAANWRNRSVPDMPPLDCAFRLDQAAIIEGKRPALLHRYAAELGFVTIRLPEGVESEDARSGALIDAMAEVGDIPTTYRDRAADGKFDHADAQALDIEIEQAIEKLVNLRTINRMSFEDAPNVRAVN